MEVTAGDARSARSGGERPEPGSAPTACPPPPREWWRPAPHGVRPTFHVKPDLSPSTPQPVSRWRRSGVGQRVHVKPGRRERRVCRPRQRQPRPRRRRPALFHVKRASRARSPTGTQGGRWASPTRGSGRSLGVRDRVRTVPSSITLLNPSSAARRTGPARDDALSNHSGRAHFTPQHRVVDDRSAIAPRSPSSARPRTRSGAARRPCRDPPGRSRSRAAVRRGDVHQASTSTDRTTVSGSTIPAPNRETLHRLAPRERNRAASSSSSVAALSPLSACKEPPAARSGRVIRASPPVRATARAVT